MIMSDVLEEYGGKVSIDGNTITNLQLTDDIDTLVEEQQGVQALFIGLDKASTRYKMEISAKINVDQQHEWH